MKQWRCTVCGYIFEGQNPPEACPQCKAPASKFEEVKEDGNMVWAAEHQVGIAKDVDEEIKAGLRANFEGECSEVGMYLEMRVAAEFGATQGKVDLATLAKKQNLDAIHDSVHEMARDEARHGRAFQGLLKRYFGEEK